MSDLYPGYTCTKKIFKEIHQFFSFYTSYNPKGGGYEIYNFLTLQMLHTKFGEDRFNSSWEDINGQAIAMGHSSYSGDLKTALYMVSESVMPA